MNVSVLRGSAPRQLGPLGAGALWRGVVLSCVLAGCRPPEDSAPASRDEQSQGNAAEAERSVLRVPEALIEQGRITLTEVVAHAHAGSTVVPGEVAPAPDGEAEVGSLVNGRIASLDAIEGALVKRGQVLAWIESPEVGGMRAELARARANKTAATKRVERQLALQAQGATSQSALEEAKAQLLAAEADEQAANAQLRAVGVDHQANGGRIALRSPIDGTVVERNARLGAAVATDTKLFHVVDLSKLRVHAQWSESLGPVPALRTSVIVSSRARQSADENTTCNGVIEAQLGLVRAATRSVTLRIQPSGEACAALSPGAFVDVVIASRGADTRGVRARTDEAASLWTQVPLEAVVELRGITSVFVASARAGEFEPRAVIARPSVGDVVPIEAGLKVGERVVTKGTILLKGEALNDILGEH